MSVTFERRRLVQVLSPDAGWRMGWGDLHLASTRAPTDGKLVGVLKLQNPIEASACRLMFPGGKRWDVEVVARHPSWVVVTSDVEPPD
jgi:hypothetical protein